MFAAYPAIAGCINQKMKQSDNPYFTYVLQINAFKLFYAKQLKY
jgi:hypothetical protein